MSRLTFAALSFAVLLLWSGSAQAILRETHPTTDQGEQIPSKTIKLDQGSDTPPAEPKKPKKEAKTPDRTQQDRPPRQAIKKPAKDDQNNGTNSAETGRAVGNMIGIGIGIGMGMGMGGGHRGEDRGGFGGRMGGER